MNNFFRTHINKELIVSDDSCPASRDALEAQDEVLQLHRFDTEPHPDQETQPDYHPFRHRTSTPINPASLNLKDRIKYQPYCLNCQKHLKSISELTTLLNSNRDKTTTAEKNIQEYTKLLKSKDERLLGKEQKISLKKEKLKAFAASIQEESDKLEEEKAKLIELKLRLKAMFKVIYNKNKEMNGLNHTGFSNKVEREVFSDVEEEYELDTPRKLLINRRDEIQRLMVNETPAKMNPRSSNDTRRSKADSLSHIRASSHNENRRKQEETTIINSTGELNDIQLKISHLNHKLSKAETFTFESEKASSPQNLNKDSPTSKNNSLTLSDTNKASNKDLQFLITNLKDQLTVYESRLKDSETLVFALQSQKTGLEIQLKLLETTQHARKPRLICHHQVSSLSRFSSDDDELKQKILSLEDSLSISQATIQTQQEELEELRQENSNLTEKVENLEAEIEALKEEDEKSSKSETISSSSSDSNDSEVANLINELETKLSKLVEKEEELRELEDNLTKEKNDVQAASAYVQSISEDNERNKKQIGKEQEQILMEKVKLASLYKKLEEKSLALREKEQELISFKARLDEREKLLEEKTEY